MLVSSNIDISKEPKETQNKYKIAWYKSEKYYTSGNKRHPKQANVNTDINHSSTNLIISELIASTIFIKCPKNLVILNIKKTFSQNNIAITAKSISILNLPISISARTL